ncbi:hypothetical protein HEQ62_05510 [Haematospirillum jordaniae]|uniref:Uncharacterized protein n=1 Tax=Haematospirillum jordaniae TaxID=1549855 RepID=A0A143DDM7_9PROT|nr:hypothetical protein [Haematospirillum jordaniae]AMW34383.1 hypothetical protein AY555_03355 [Haematospirillum jordaniae]NKD44645.1 hypothetical protein [Haematospirillum jordaniae]NKD57665.1 hypothetical protein [Haematospirillum jordaniae]NKD59235.1 hypothetical protein [Haematospirillum jordaniae]NKD67373.1 hypothetical protein [Haematospirillum jordaniae]
MLSLILYGRNDNHGHNLHKRAAISLNCMAELMAGTDDEILFVDYNTPDTLPTFPEAIADTLTTAAKRYLRILRVRPHHHDPIRNRTHLNVCEPVARNAALRRANPTNSWVLSTNPDMVLVPRPDRCPLSEIVATLPEACHHLPRFELPQAIWEECDRSDPAGTIAFLAEKGARLHLHHVVEGSPPARFDNHGDFQLIPRTALETIHGFDERMLNGWIVDSNLAKRLLIHLGPPQSLETRLLGFHCDHTRGGGILHGHNHTENDYWSFYRDITEDKLPHQADSWGLANTELEEIRLRHRTFTVSGFLANVLPPPERTPTFSTYRPDCPDMAGYDPHHTLPFLVDLLVHQPRDRQLAWFGTRTDMLGLAQRAWKNMAFQGSFEANNNIALKTANILVFEFGRPEETQQRSLAGWSQTDLDALAPVHDTFLRMVDIEQDRISKGLSPRMVITINAIHNRFETMVNACLNSSRTPFSGRVRHGTVTPSGQLPLRLTPHDLAAWLQTHMQRAQPVPVTEAVRLSSVIEGILRGSPTAWQEDLAGRAGEAVLAALSFPPLTERYPEETLCAARNRVTELRPSTRLISQLAIPLLTKRPGPLEAPSRLAGAEDWEDRTWLDLNRRYLSGTFAANLFRRTQDTFSAVHIAATARHIGVADQDKKALVTTLIPHLPDILSRHMKKVSLLGHTKDLDGIHIPNRMNGLDRCPDQEVFDLVITRHTDTAQLVAPGGILVVVQNVRLDQAIQPPELLGWTLLDPAPIGVSTLTLDLMVNDDMTLAATWFFQRSDIQ